MNYEAVFRDLAQQYQASGGDVNEAMSWLSAMASDNRTPFLKLNQWKRSDKPVMDDFNEDNRKIDEGFQEVWEKKASKDGTLQSRLNAELHSGWKLFSDVSELGLSDNNDLTMQQICKAMPDKSILIHSKVSTTPATSYPATAGQLTVVRINQHRIQLIFTHQDVRTWSAYYNQSSEYYRGWSEQYNNGQSMLPGADNTYSIGSATKRFRQVYAGTGTINTSDARQKTDITPLDQVRSFFMALNPVAFRWRDGTGGRRHHGLIAQEVESAMAANGISDLDFAGLIKSPVYKEEVCDTGDGPEEIPAEDREIADYAYGLRYCEFIPMLIKMVQEQQKEIDALKAGTSAAKSGKTAGKSTAQQSKKEKA